MKRLSQTKRVRRSKNKRTRRRMHKGGDRVHLNGITNE